eukprot:TRINITY_DN1410_c0_g1_i2.p1 TRINITY_DN1410_c0_g1~~TRINITY_DN1410_c0_g1_i2.p1  ORF type:complete len:147 (-),score=22.65 TRINITY_DN1410_c0_g1_i2:12-452(-)
MKISQISQVVYQAADIIQCEFYLLDGLKCHLLLYHPYMCLQDYLNDCGLAEYKEDVWKIINDTYRTDVCLTTPPHIITLACIYFTATLKEKDVSQWFDSLNFDVSQMGEVLQELISLYELWTDTFDAEAVLLLKSKILTQTTNKSK